MVSYNLDTGAIDELRREVGAEYPRYAQRAATATLRKAATRAWNAARRQADLDRSDRRRRVYVRRRRTAVGAALWLGIDDVPAHRVRGAVTGVSRQTRVQGRQLPRVFRPKAGMPAFQRQGPTRFSPIEVYRLPLDEVPIESALGDVDEAFEADVLAVVERLARGDL